MTMRNLVVCNTDRNATNSSSSMSDDHELLGAHYEQGPKAQAPFLDAGLLIAMSPHR